MEILQMLEREACTQWPRGIDVLHVDLCILDTQGQAGLAGHTATSGMDKMHQPIQHTAAYTPSTQRCLLFVTLAIVCHTLWKACRVLLKLGYCVNVGSSAWVPKGAVGLTPADQRDCPCLGTVHITSLFPPLFLSRPEADQTSGTSASEAAFPTSNFHRLFCKNSPGTHQRTGLLGK